MRPVKCNMYDFRVFYQIQVRRGLPVKNIVNLAILQFPIGERTAWRYVKAARDGISDTKRTFQKG